MNTGAISRLVVRDIARETDGARQITKQRQVFLGESQFTKLGKCGFVTVRHSPKLREFELSGTDL